MNSGVSGERTSRADHRSALAAIEQEKERLRAQIHQFDVEEQNLSASEQRLDQQAKDIEDQARRLSEEEALLLTRKKQLQEQARQIGIHRADCANKRKKLFKDKESLSLRLSHYDNQIQRIDQAIAVEEAQKVASIQPLREYRQPEAKKDIRTSPRIKAQVDVSIHTEHNFYAGVTENISEGGIFIATYEEMPIGTELDLTVSLPKRAPIHVKGRVCWKREYTIFTQDFSPGVGVAFQNLKDSDLQIIQQFILERSPLLFET